ncbi:MAG: hypothetical protein ACRDSE_24090 [Pseudonocardiaceae bacterium]
MAMLTELHAQAAVWADHDWRLAVLYLEGEAPDPATGGMLAGALLAAVRARGLRLTTDPDHLSLRPIPGWRVRLDDPATITVEWPHFTPLLTAAPLRLPDGWREAATELGAVVVFAGCGLGLHEHAADGHAHATHRLHTAAEHGNLAGGTVPLEGSEARAARLDGTASRPGHTPTHRPALGVLGDWLHQEPWWSRRLHGHA